MFDSTLPEERTYGTALLTQIVFSSCAHAMLKRYFDKQGVLTAHDFSDISETKIEPIYQAWLTLPDAQRGEMELDFKEIDALACEGGVKAIMDEAEWHDENLADILGELEDLHQKKIGRAHV